MPKALPVIDTTAPVCCAPVAAGPMSDDDALQEVARISRARDTGARGLRSVVEKVMFDIMYELPDQERGGTYVITPEVVRGEHQLFKKDGSAAA